MFPLEPATFRGTNLTLPPSNLHRSAPDNPAGIAGVRPIPRSRFDPCPLGAGKELSHAWFLRTLRSGGQGQRDGSGGDRHPLSALGLVARDLARTGDRAGAGPAAV